MLKASTADILSDPVAAFLNNEISKGNSILFITPLYKLFSGSILVQVVFSPLAKSRKKDNYLN